MNRLYRPVRWLFAAARRCARRAIACAMMLSFLLANFGYPVWEPVTAKGDVPFPCQFSRCGCQTLEQCRQSCCRHSKREKVAWALARGIDPDQIAILTPEEKFQYTFEARAKVQIAKTDSCCSPKPSCCSKGSHQAEACATSESPAELRWVLAIAAQKCRGTAVDWLQAGFVTEPPAVVMLSIEVPEVAFLAIRDSACSVVSPEPLFRPA